MGNTNEAQRAAERHLIREYLQKKRDECARLADVHRFRQCGCGKFGPRVAHCRKHQKNFEVKRDYLTRLIQELEGTDGGR